MASKSRSGLSREQRESYLRENGFTPARNGKGSHEIWENGHMRNVATNNKLEIPETLKKGAVWQVTLCGDPAFGTWQAIVKQVEWINQTIQNLGQQEEKQSLMRSIKVEFNKKAQQYQSWKKEVRQQLKAGVALSQAPVSYSEIKELYQQKRSFSLGIPAGGR